MVTGSWATGSWATESRRQNHGDGSRREARHSLGGERIVHCPPRTASTHFARGARITMLRTQRIRVFEGGAAHHRSGGRCDGPRRATVSQQSGVARGLGALFHGSLEPLAPESGETESGVVGGEDPSGVKTMSALGD